MKRLLILTIALSFGANAEFTEEDKKFCKTLSEVAEKTMRLRQMGAPMHIIMGSATGDLDAMIIKGAYKQPRMNVESNQDKYVQDYANQWYLSCFEARSED